MSDAPEPLLELRGVTVLADGRPVVEGLDLVLAAGERAAVTGPSGSGKSTLLRAAAGLEEPAAGAVIRRALRPAFVFQEGGLISNTSVADNLLLPLFYQGLSKATGMLRVEAALERFGLSAIAAERPGSLVAETRQLVQIARADALDADLLFLEMPPSALEPVAVGTVRAWLEERVTAGKLAVMLTALTAAELAGFTGRIIRLEGGELERGGETRR